MFRIDSFVRGRFGLFLAWLAIAGLGVVAGARDMGLSDRLASPTDRAILRTLDDIGHPFIRGAGLKLQLHYRVADDHKRPQPGDGPPATLPAIVEIAGIGASPPLDVTRLSVDRAGRRAAPYSARAPPLASV